MTVQGILGVEFGNSASNATTTVTTIPPVPGGAGAFITATSLQGFDVRTRYFDKINVAIYPLPDLKLFVGHRYLGGMHALALGSEFALPMRGEARAALFVEGRIGEGDFHGAWGGLRVYFGKKDKPLIRRHREDDPIEWMPEGLGSLTNSTTRSTTTSATPIPPLPPPCNDNCN